MSTAAARRHRRPPRLLMGGLLVVAVWGTTPPWVGPWVGWSLPGVSAGIEVVDHAVPGVVVGAVAIAGLAGRLPLAASLVAVLAALWMTATHLPLLAQARAGLVEVDAAVFHSLPGVVLLALTVAVAIWAWRDDARVDHHTDTRRPAGRRPTQ